MDVVLARWQMGWSLGFHIVFASIGVAMPVLMVAAELAWRRTGDTTWLDLAKRWAKGTAVFFAVGAVSGTVLSFELGLLFPTFMRHAGPLVGVPFSLEGFAFFTEAIFLGLYLYGWDRLTPAVHVLAGAVVALSGLLSAGFVTFVNAWMNAPRGFTLEHGALAHIDPLGALASPFAWHEIPHAALAAYATTAFGVAAIHAWGLRRAPDSRLHRNALALALAMAIPSALAQPLVGDFAGKQVAAYQPAKLAAIEALAHTQAHAPEHIGPIEIPGLVSWLATGDADATVQGLDAFAPDDRPPPFIRPAFQVMVGLGTAMALYALVAAWRAWRGTWARGRWWLYATIALGPAGAVATEAGWIVTELGRQPWTIYGVLRTHDAATRNGVMWLPLATFVAVYVGLAAVVVAILVRHVRQTTEAR
jgi:cytochrome d ubiquinol oxidase subunit I